MDWFALHRHIARAGCTVAIALLQSYVVAATLSLSRMYLSSLLPVRQMESVTWPSTHLTEIPWDIHFILINGMLDYY